MTLMNSIAKTSTCLEHSLQILRAPSILFNQSVASLMDTALAVGQSRMVWLQSMTPVGLVLSGQAWHGGSTPNLGAMLDGVQISRQGLSLRLNLQNYNLKSGLTRLKILNKSQRGHNILFSSCQRYKILLLNTNVFLWGSTSCEKQLRMVFCFSSENNGQDQVIKPDNNAHLEGDSFLTRNQNYDQMSKLPNRTRCSSKIQNVCGNHP